MTNHFFVFESRLFAHIPNLILKLYVLIGVISLVMDKMVSGRARAVKGI
jgi:hypothetical protein